MDKIKQYKSLTSLVLLFKSYMEIFKDSENVFDIIIDYNQSNEEYGIFHFGIIEKNSEENIFESNFVIECTDSEFVRDIIDEIRTHFILGNHISISDISNEKILITLPRSKNMSYARIHDIKNSKFRLTVLIRNEKDLKRAEIAQILINNKEKIGTGYVFKKD